MKSLVRGNPVQERIVNHCHDGFREFSGPKGVISNLTVLVISTNEKAIGELPEMLKSCRCVHVVGIEDREEYGRILKAVRYDAVIFTGFRNHEGRIAELSRELKENGTKVIIITGFPEWTPGRERAKALADHVIGKPLENQRLIQALES